MRRIAFFLAVVVVVLGVVLWPRSTPSPAPRTPIRNVVLISLDTTRADHLGCYGHPGSTTPNIDAVAAEGVLFENVVAPVPLTLPSHVSMLTGTSPRYHGVHDNLFMALRPDVPTLAAVLRDEGFATGAVIGAPVLHRMYGLKQGFETYLDGLKATETGSTASERRGDDTSRLGIEWLDRNLDDRFFLFLHYYDPHFEYAPPEPFATRFRDDPYAGEIAFADDCVGQVITRLKELDLYDSTLIVIVGDHGEMLDEHGEPAHGYFIYRSALEVPLIMRGPGLPAGHRVESIAGVVDVTPTILSLLGVDPPSPQHGIDLATLIDDDRHRDERYLYCESVTPVKYLAGGLWGLVGERWKYIQTSRPELYDLSADPGERRNLFSEEPDVAEELRGRLEEALAAETGVAADVNLDAETLARLQSLGYVGSAADLDGDLAFDQDRPDPKDLVDLHNRFIEFQHLQGAGRLDEAQEIGAALLELNPELPVVLEGMCGLALKQSRYEEAVAHCSRALEINADLFGAARDLGQSQAALGRIDEAIESYRQAVRIRPNAPRVHYNLAHLHYQRGEMESALEHANISAELNPNVAAVQVSLAATYRELGRNEEAIEHYYKVVQLEPTSARHLDALAWLLATTGTPTADRIDEAVRLAGTACAMTQFTVPGAIETLAAASAAQGNFERAIQLQQQAFGLYRDPDKRVRAQRRLGLYEVELPLGEDD